MQCLVCGKIIERQKSWEHIRTVHLKPIEVTQEKILEHARGIAYPCELRTAHLTCINLEENIIYFSLDNTELSIAFAWEHGNVPWMEVVEWRVLHEMGHLTCKSLYEPPKPCSLHALMNAEDYYINKHLMPKKYWQACIMNARCATVIRNIAPLPYDFRDGYFYSTLGTFLAYDAVTLADFGFLNSSEVRFVEIISTSFRKIKEVKHIPIITNEIDEAFEQLYPPRGI